MLYHPRSAVANTPAQAGIGFEPVGFAATETGQLQLQGWWIPAAQSAALSRYTVLYLHGATGNMGESVDALAHLHSLGVNILAFDYRGYGQSFFAHPSEARWQQDANWALAYLINTRHIASQSIVLDGEELGADLAVEVATTHTDLAGVIVDAPMEDPVGVIFGDSRADLVPAHLLVRDRYDLDAAAAQLRVPSLWLLTSTATVNAGEPTAFAKLTAPHELARFGNGQTSADLSAAAIAKWLTDLSGR